MSDTTPLDTPSGYWAERAFLEERDDELDPLVEFDRYDEARSLYRASELQDPDLNGSK